MTKRKSRARFILMSFVLLAGILLSVLQFNIPFTDTTFMGFVKAIPLGFDLQGGVSVVFEASNPDDDLTADLDLGIKGTISRIELLLNNENYTEHNVYTQSGNRIVVEVPQLDNMDFLFKQLEQPASFKITTENDADADAHLTGDDIEYAGYSAQQNSAGVLQQGVAIQFNEEGTDKFATLTADVASNNKTMYIFVGDQTTAVTSLTSSGAIKTGQMFISSTNMTEEAAREMALKILSGSFDAKLVLIQNSVVSASLGMDALRLGTISIFVSLAVSIILFVLFYKHYGLLSSFATLFWAVLMIFFLQSVPFATLTISSFAGIIICLSINFLAYTIIFENIKQENAKGKKLHMSVNSGLKKSMATVADIHAIGLIASIVLLIIGTQAIKGFAVALLLGSAISLFTSLVLFRFFVKMYLPLNSTNVKKFGLEKVEVKIDEVR